MSPRIALHVALLIAAAYSVGAWIGIQFAPRQVEDAEAGSRKTEGPAVKCAVARTGYDLVVFSRSNAVLYNDSIRNEAPRPDQRVLHGERECSTQIVQPE